MNESTSSQQTTDASSNAQPQPQPPATAAAAATSIPPHKNYNYRSLHFIWFAGHVMTVINTLLYFASKVVYKPLGLYYRLAYVGTLIAYGIVLFNSYQPLSNQHSYFKRMLLDENFQYYIVALYFTFAKMRIAVSLLPFFIYSLFHVLEYIHSNIIPHFASHRTTLQRKIKRLVDMHYDPSVKLVSKIEIFGVMTRLILGLFVFKSTLLSVLIYSQFLRMRYYMSGNTRECFNSIGQKMDHIFVPDATTGHAKVPSAVSNFYVKVRYIVTKQATKKKHAPQQTTTASSAVASATLLK